MGKTLKKIILTMVFLTLAVALVYGADMLDISKSNKIEKIDDTYYVYTLENKYTTEEINKEKQLLIDKITDRSDKNHLVEFYSLCVTDCVDMCNEPRDETKEFILLCKEDCIYMCEERTRLEELFEEETINLYQEKLKYLIDLETI